MVQLVTRPIRRLSTFHRYDAMFLNGRGYLNPRTLPPPPRVCPHYPRPSMTATLARAASSIRLGEGCRNRRMLTRAVRVAQPRPRVGEEKWHADGILLSLLGDGPDDRFQQAEKTNGSEAPANMGKPKRWRGRSRSMGRDWAGGIRAESRGRRLAETQSEMWPKRGRTLTG